MLDLVDHKGQLESCGIEKSFSAVSRMADATQVGKLTKCAHRVCAPDAMVMVRDSLRGGETILFVWGDHKPFSSVPSVPALRGASHYVQKVI